MSNEQVSYALINAKRIENILDLIINSMHDTDENLPALCVLQCISHNLISSIEGAQP